VRASRGSDPALSRNQGHLIAWDDNTNGASNVASSPTRCGALRRVMAQRKGSLGSSKTLSRSRRS